MSEDNDVGKREWNIVIERFANQNMDREKEILTPPDSARNEKIGIVLPNDCVDMSPDEIAALKDQISRDLTINPFRRFVCLSPHYRSSLYDRLGAAYPEVFNYEEDLHCQQKICIIMDDFLRQQLRSDKIEVNEDVFGMLWLDFISSQEFYMRQATQKK